MQVANIGGSFKPPLPSPLALVRLLEQEGFRLLKEKAPFSRNRKLEPAKHPPSPGYGAAGAKLVVSGSRIH